MRLAPEVDLSTGVEVALTATGQDERDVSTRVAVALAELVDPYDYGVVEQCVVALLDAVHHPEQVSELLRVPLIDFEQVRFGAPIAVVVVRQTVVTLVEDLGHPVETHATHGARPLQRRNTGEVARERHDQHVHLSLAGDRVHVVLLETTAGEGQVGRGAGFAEVGRHLQAPLQIANRLQVLVELLLVVISQTILECRMVFHDRVEDALSSPLNQLQSEWIRIDVAEEVLEILIWVFTRRHWLIRRAVRHSRPNRRALHLHAKLERFELGDDVLRDLIGEVLVHGLAASPADVLLLPRITRAFAEQGAGKDLGVAEHASHAGLMPIADGVVGDLLVDTVEEDQLVRERRHRRVQRMTAQIHVGRRAPDVLPCTVGSEPEDDTFRRAPCLRRPSLWQHGVQHR